MGPCWVGFHIALKQFPFLSWWDWGAKAGATLSGPEDLRFRTAALPLRGHRVRPQYDVIPARRYQAWFVAVIVRRRGKKSRIQKYRGHPVANCDNAPRRENPRNRGKAPIITK